MPGTVPLELVRITQETPQDRTLRLEPPPAERERLQHFVPGQFLVLHDTLDGAPVARAYSLSSAPGAPLEITVRDMGAYGHHLYGLPRGSVVQASPPRGHFTLEAEVQGTLLLAAGGAGLTPFRSFVRALVARGHDRPVSVLHSVRTPAELLFRAELETLSQAHPWLAYVPRVTRAQPGDGWSGLTGRLDAAGLRARLPASLHDTLLYACGPSAFVEATLAAAAGLGLAAGQLRRERWG